MLCLITLLVTEQFNYLPQTLFSQYFIHYIQIQNLYNMYFQQYEPQYKHF